MEGQTPMLLSSNWLYDQEFIIDFKTGQALLPKISNGLIQLSSNGRQPFTSCFR